MLSFGNQYKLTLMLASLFVCSVLYGQYDSIPENDKYSSVSLGVDVMSDNSVNGRFSMFGSQPNLTTMASYYHKSGFDITAMYSNVWKSDETNSKATQELGLSLGYNLDFAEWLSGSVSYSHYYYSINSHSLRSIYKHLFSVGLYSEVDWWLADVIFGYYSGKSNELFVAFETGVSIDFDDVLKKGNTLSIQPMISAYMGDINYYNSDAYRNYYFLYATAQRFPNATIGEYIEFLERQKEDKTILEKRRIQRKIDKANLLEEDFVFANLFKEQETFDFNNIGFTIPIYYYWGDFMVNVGFSAFKPVNQPSYVDVGWSGYTNAGLTYFISW